MTAQRKTTEKDRARCRAWRAANKGKVSAYNKKYAAINRDAIKKRMVKWIGENRETVTETARAWRANNAERVREASKERNRRYYSRHPEKVKAANDKWNDEHPERKKENARRRQAEHPEKHRDYEHKRRAKKNGVGAEKINDTDIYERDKWVCQLCKKKVSKKLKYPNPLSPSIDHIIPLSKGGPHSRANVQLAHLRCNIKTGIGGIKQPRLF
jgi:hypothetical protein